MPKAKVFLTNVVFAIVAAGFTYWLSAEFRTDGPLGTLQRLAQPFVFLPYLASAMFGESAHSPSEPSFAVALFVQYFLLFAVLSKILRRSRART
jgi:hypothetical protein